MPGRWGKTSNAINIGYGDIHPEYLMQAPYGDQPIAKYRLGRELAGKKRRRTYNSSALLGGGYNTAALEGCGYNTAALEGCGYNTAALEGCGYNTAALEGLGCNCGSGYNTAALEGFGKGVGEEFGRKLQEQSDAIEGAMGKLLNKLVEQTGQSITELLSDPDKLMITVKDYMPMMTGLVKRFIKRIKRRNKEKDAILSSLLHRRLPEKEKRHKFKELLLNLKQQDPEAYQRLIKKLHEKEWEEQKKENSALFN